MFFRSLRRTFLTPVRLFGGILFLSSGGDRTALRGLLLPGLLLAGHGLLLALAGAGIGLRALAVHGQPTAVPDALVAPDLDLAPDVGLHLAAQVTFDLVVGVDPVPEPDEIVVAEVVDPGVAADLGGLECLQGPGAADSVNVCEGDLEPLVTREVDADEACHRGQFSFWSRRSCAPLPGVPARTGPRPPPGEAPNRPECRLRAAVRVCSSWVLFGLAQPWRCLCRGSVQMTMTRPCRRMIRHLLQIFFTLGLTFMSYSSRF